MTTLVWENKHIVIYDTVIDGNDPFAVIDPVWCTGNIYDGPARYKKSLELFSKPQIFVFAALWYISEINNGGHDQFYFNSTGVVWRDAVDGFNAFGINEVSKIIVESADRLGGNPSLDRDRRQVEMEKYTPSFHDLDDLFYDFENRTDIDTMIMEYVRQNRSDFYFKGYVSVPK